MQCYWFESEVPIEQDKFVCNRFFFCEYVSVRVYVSEFACTIISKKKIMTDGLADLLEIFK